MVGDEDAEAHQDVIADRDRPRRVDQCPTPDMGTAPDADGCAIALEHHTCFHIAVVADRDAARLPADIHPRDGDAATTSGDDAAVASPPLSQCASDPPQPVVHAADFLSLPRNSPLDDHCAAGANAT